MNNENFEKNKCRNCGAFMKNVEEYCEQCGHKVIKCLNCNNIIPNYEGYCGYCGENLQEQKKSIDETQKRNEELQNIKQQTSDILIECAGNKFSAIGILKERFQIDTETATKMVNDVYSFMDNLSEIKNNDEENDINKPSIESIVIKNNYERIASIRDVRDVFGYDLVEAKNAVEDVINKQKSGDTDILNEIKKTVIVATDSRKKATSTVARSAIGGVLLGPAGLFAGLSAKNKNTTTFQIYYNNGKISTVTVKNNSWMFNKLCQYLEK